MGLKDIAVYGAGGFGREVQMLISQLNRQQPAWNLVGFFDDGVPKGTIVNGSPVLGGIQEANSWSKPLNVVCAIGIPAAKRKIIESISNSKISYPVLVHPSAIVGDEAFVSIDAGTIIAAGSIVEVNIEIGKHVFLSLACTVGHDVKIGNYSSIMPGVNISGEVGIGEEVFIGTGASVINQVSIGTGTTIGSGSAVIDSIPAHCTAVGCPARPIKRD